MFKISYIRNILFILLALYYAQGTLYPQGSPLSQGILLIVLGISFYFFIKTLLLRNNKTLFYKIWTALLSLNVLGFVFTGVLSNPYHFSMLKGILLTSLTFYPFYYLSRRNLLKSKHLSNFLLLFLPFVILQFILKSNQIIDARISGKTDVVNNVAYVFVALIPYVFLFKRRIISSLLMLILIFFIIQGAKRGALLSGVIGLLCLGYFQIRIVEKGKRTKEYLIASLLIIGIMYYAYDVYQSNVYLMDRMQSISEGNSSGRNVIFKNVFYNWYQSNNYLNLLFGFGYAASLDLSEVGLFAHNDWLELLSNFGLLGLALYIAFFVVLAKKIIVSDWKLDKRLILLAFFLIWLMNTLVYRFYSAGEGFLYSIFLAYLIGNTNRKIN